MPEKEFLRQPTTWKDPSLNKAYGERLAKLYTLDPNVTQGQKSVESVPLRRGRSPVGAMPRYSISRSAMRRPTSSTASFRAA